MKLMEQVANREQGQYPLSIGTSIALEGAFGTLETQEAGKPPPIISSTDLWFNVRTLFRNLLDAIEPETKNSVVATDLIDTLKMEMETIKDLVNEFTSNKVKVTFYLCTFDSFNRVFPNAIAKNPTTDIQINNATIERQTLELLMSFEDNGVDLFDVKLDKGAGRTLLSTHLPIDLLSSKYFTELSLLESHTGKVKGRTFWNSKLTGGKKNVMLPFNPMTIQIFGDNNNMFKSFPIKIKRKILEVAVEKRWTPVTSKDKILHNLKGSGEVETVVKKLFDF